MNHSEKVRVRNVLRRVFAKEESKDTENNKEDLSSGSSNATPITQFFYYYKVNTPSSILFSNLPELIIADPKKNSVILNSGWSGKYGDHFKWTGVVVKTNVLGDGEVSSKGFVAYYCDLSESGSRVRGTDKIIPDERLGKDPSFKGVADISIEEFIKNNNIFLNNKVVPDFIYLEQKPGFGFYKEATQGLEQSAKEVLSNNYSGSEDSYKEFEGKIFSNFRMWVNGAGEDRKGALLYPNLDVPKDYLGNKKYRDALEKRVRENSDLKDYSIEKYSGGPDNSFEVDKKESPEDTRSTGKEDNPFVPVDSKPTDGKPLPKDASKKEKSEKDYSEEPYGGGFSIMQNLVKDQVESMKIRKAAQRVVQAGLNFSNPSSSSSSHNSQGTMDTNKAEKEIKLTKELTDARKELKKTMDTMKSADSGGAEGIDGVLEDPSGLTKDASVANVLKRYFN